MKKEKVVTVKSYFVTNEFLCFMNFTLFPSIDDEEDEETPPQFEKMLRAKKSATSSKLISQISLTSSVNRVSIMEKFLVY